MREEAEGHTSLENLLEFGDLGLEVLHPKGLQITTEFASLCHLGKGDTVLDVASGTGESARFLAQEFGCCVTGADASEYMVSRAKKKGVQRGLALECRQSDAHHLPFGEDLFDAVLSEYTVCLVDKERALHEMVTIAKPGGYVGIHDICWEAETSQQVKASLAEIEGERSETLEGWRRLLEVASLREGVTVHRCYLIDERGQEVRKELGFFGAAKILFSVFRKWGLRGLRGAWESARIFQGRYTGYGIIVGRKP